MAEKLSGIARTVRSASENPAVLAIGLVTAALAVFSLEIRDLPIAIRVLFLTAIAVIFIQTAWHTFKLVSGASFLLERRCSTPSRRGKIGSHGLEKSAKILLKD